LPWFPSLTRMSFHKSFTFYMDRIVHALFFPRRLNAASGTTPRPAPLLSPPPCLTSLSPAYLREVFSLQLRRGRRTSLSEGEKAREAAQRTPEEEEEEAAEEEEEKENTTPKERIRCIERRDRHTGQPRCSAVGKMELPAAGEHVFAVESIEKKRSRKVRHEPEGRPQVMDSMWFIIIIIIIIIIML